MPSTITLANTITWAQQFVRVRPLALGTPNEPAITTANIIKATMLNAPFAWAWNRAAATAIPTVQGTQDYAPSIPTFGWLESASILDSSDNKYHQVSVLLNIELDSSQGRPQNVSIHTDDNNGTLHVRLMPVPAASGSLVLTTQQAPVLFAALSDTWAPIPDKLSFVYLYGFLALMFLYTDDARFPITNQKFVASLLSVAQGLKQSQVNIFLNQWQAITGTPLSFNVDQTQGEQARGL